MLKKKLDSRFFGKIHRILRKWINRNFGKSCQKENEQKSRYSVEKKVDRNPKRKLEDGVRFKKRNRINRKIIGIYPEEFLFKGKYAVYRHV